MSKKDQTPHALARKGTRKAVTSKPARRGGRPGSAPKLKKGQDHRTAPAVVPQGTKQSQIIALLSRSSGATLDDLIAATGWLPHTTRAALTGLRKKGYTLETSKTESGTTTYRITEAPSPAVKCEAA
jgi:hypothetical protein